MVLLEEFSFYRVATDTKKSISAGNISWTFSAIFVLSVCGKRSPFCERLSHKVVLLTGALA
jgi:hypothetical protein